jgi:post-segregation antitoxin (ccd killing protein)
MHSEIKMPKKTRTTLYIDKETIKEAQELGLNISKTCEIALKQAIEQLRALYGKKKSKDCSDSSQNSNWWGRPDSNRGPESPSLRA